MNSSIELVTKIVTLLAAIIALISAMLTLRKKKDDTHQAEQNTATVKKKGDFLWAPLLILLVPILVMLWLAAMNWAMKLHAASLK